MTSRTLRTRVSAYHLSEPTLRSPCVTAACRIVLENSGVAEPANIRDKFKEAEDEGHPLLDRIYLDTLVTVVRCASCRRHCIVLAQKVHLHP